MSRIKLKSLLTEETFLIAIWSHVFGFIGQGMVSVVLILILWGMSNTTASFFDILQLELGRIVRWTLLISILMNIALFLINWSISRPYFLQPSTNMQSSLKIVGEKIRNENEEVYYFMKYTYPILMGVLTLISFVNQYFFEGVRGEVLRGALTFILPFTVALTVAHFSRILVEIIELFLRSLFNNTR